MKGQSRSNIFIAILIIFSESAMAEKWVTVPQTQYYLDADSAQRRGVLGRVTGMDKKGGKRVFEFDCDQKTNFETGQSVDELEKREASVLVNVTWPYIYAMACNKNSW